MFVKIELRIGSCVAGKCDIRWVLMVLKLDMSSTPSFSFDLCPLCLIYNGTDLFS